MPLAVAMPVSGTVTYVPAVTAPELPAIVELIVGALLLVIVVSPQVVFVTRRTVNPDVCAVSARTRSETPLIVPVSPLTTKRM